MKQSFPQRKHPRCVLGLAKFDFGGVPEPPERVLSVFGTLLGAYWSFLSASWAPLGRLLDALVGSWVHLGSQGRLCPRFRQVFGQGQTGFWKGARPGFGTHFAYTRLMHIMHLIAAGTSLLHLLTLFFSPLQRGGTCAAHPPPPEGRAVRARHPSFHLLYCLPLRLAFRIRLQIPSSKAFHPHPFVPSPGSARTAALRPQFALEASKCDF